jgi:peptidoglycan hydrolase CwlO-like protein
MREANFRKINKQNIEKWCAACRTTMSMVSNISTTLYGVSFVGSNEKLSNLTESVKFMSNKFDDVFGKQLNEVLNSIKKLKEENSKLKENNSILYEDVRKLNRKINGLEQK